jgi:hypothetical protein
MYPTLCRQAYGRNILFDYGLTYSILLTVVSAFHGLLPTFMTGNIRHCLKKKEISNSSPVNNRCRNDVIRVFLLRFVMIMAFSCCSTHDIVAATWPDTVKIFFYLPRGNSENRLFLQQQVFPTAALNQYL